jgi:probable HAF family extracellular repeat protein
MPAILAHQRLAVTAIAASAVLCSAAVAQSITNLGTLNDATDSFALGISRDGSTVAGHSGGRAFRWSASTGMQALPLLGPSSPATASAGYAVNGDGSVIVGGVDGRAVRWTSGGVVQDLGTLGGSGSYALDVSSDGNQIVGYSGTSSFRWSASSGMHPLAAESQARGITGDGQTAVGHLYSNSSAFRSYGSGVVESIISGAGAEDVSDDGSVVVGWAQTGSGQRAFRWTAAGVQMLPSLLGGISAYAEAVSGNGSVVVGADNSLAGERALLWSDVTGSVSLFEYLTLRGADMTGWSALTSAHNISSDGRFVVGHGVFNGSSRAFIADIGVIPTPGALALLGLVGLARSRRR